MSTDNAAPVQGGITPAMARYGLVMLTVVYAFNFIDRQILVILQESIKLDMGLSDAQLGLLSGFSFALVYVTAGIPIAYWADRGNRRNIIALALTVWSGMTALSGLAQNYLHLLLARVGVGLGEAGGSPPAHSMISDYFPPHKRGSALAFYSAGLHVGIFLGFLTGGIISQVFGWRMAFMAVGIPGVLFALLFFLTVREPLRGHWDSKAAQSHKPGLGDTVQLLGAYRSFWLLSAGMGFAAFGGYGVGNFTPSFFVRNHGLSIGEVGLLLAICGGLAGATGTLLGGIVGDRLGARDMRWYLWAPACAGLCALPLAFPYLLLDSLGPVIVLSFAMTMLTNTYLGPGLAVAHTLVPPAMRALTSAVLFFVINIIGLGLGPLTVGLLSDLLAPRFGDDSLRYAMLVCGLISALSIPLFIAAAKRLPADLARNPVSRAP